MQNKIIIELEKRLREDISKINIGDELNRELLKLSNEEEMSLENVLSLLYDMGKINQYKIESLENNLDILASRIYDTKEDFTKEEKVEINSILKKLEIEQLNSIDTFKDILNSKTDNLELINKIKYPTIKMNSTLKELVSYEIKFRKEAVLRDEDNYEDILEIKTDEDMLEFVQIQNCFKRNELILIANALKTANSNAINNDPKQFLLMEVTNLINESKLQLNGVNLEEIQCKINDISKFQAYQLINMLSDLLIN